MSSLATYVDVTSLLARYWSAIERYRYEDALAMLTDDVEYRVGNGATGRSAAVRHLQTGFVIEPVGDSLHVSYTQVAFGRIAEKDEKPPFPTSAPSSIADMKVTMVRDGDGLKISRVAASLVFQQPR
jgi:hypothetical protein